MMIQIPQEEIPAGFFLQSIRGREPDRENLLEEKRIQRLTHRPTGNLRCPPAVAAI